MAQKLKSFECNNKNEIASWPTVGIFGGISTMHNAFLDVDFNKIKICYFKLTKYFLCFQGKQIIL